jgi:site-specific DNA-methyltransferase (adenine-specific)
MFKYWIALDIANEYVENGLNCNHIGLLMYVKGKNVPFKLNTDTVRIPYTACKACNNNTKDWGGKKHQINKAGSCISDVWKDFYSITELIDDPQIWITTSKITVKRD